MADGLSYGLGFLRRWRQFARIGPVGWNIRLGRDDYGMSRDGQVRVDRRKRLAIGEGDGLLGLKLLDRQFRQVSFVGFASRHVALLPLRPRGVAGTPRGRGSQGQKNATASAVSVR
jgi:hypothetical protein